MSKNKPAPEGAAGEEARAAAAAGGVDWSKLTVELRHGEPTRFKRQEINARFMTAAQMDQLVANLETDGVLTSLPLCYEDPDLKAAGTPVEEILSGHHRIEGAIRARLNAIDYLCITSKLTDERKRAIQLSHNALVGQDDQATLAAMYAGLGLVSKAYSGLDDSVLDATKNLSLAGLSIGVKYQEMNLFFLPEDAAVVAQALQRFEKAARKNRAYVARYEDFDAFFALAVKAKTQFNAFNSAIALRLIVDLASERLAELEPATQPEEAGG